MNKMKVYNSNLNLDLQQNFINIYDENRILKLSEKNMSNSK